MKYTVIAKLQLETPAKRDALTNELKTFIGRKLVWGETRTISDEDKDGKPISIIEVRFNVQANMDDLYALIKDRMQKIPVLSGSVSKHPCPHDEDANKSCVITEEYRK